MNIGLFLGASPTPYMILSSREQLKWCGDAPLHRKLAWRAQDMDSGEILKAYTPPPKEKRPRPCTPFKGSWADQMLQNHK